MSEHETLYEWTEDGRRMQLFRDADGEAAVRRLDSEGKAGNLMHSAWGHAELLRLAPLAQLLDPEWTPSEEGLAALPDRVRIWTNYLQEREGEVEDLRERLADALAYPTASAYEKACAALEKHRKRADDAEAQLAEAQAENGRLRDEVDGLRRLGMDGRHGGRMP